MKLKSLLVFACAMIFAIGTAGCSSFKTSPPTGDPPGAGVNVSDALTLRAEQVIASSAAVADAFVRWEYVNRESLPESVTRIADDIRDQHELWINARSFLRSYKAGNLNNAGTLSIILDQLELIESIATKSLIQRQ